MERGTCYPRWQCASILALCAGILAARRPDLLARPQLWAEDGTVFFTDAVVKGWSSLTAPYAGYLHTTPRLVALFATAFDPAVLPLLFVVATAILTLWAVSRTLSPRFPLQPRFAFALAVVMVPEAGEVLLCLTNVQSMLVLGFVAILLSDDPGTARERVHDAAATTLLGLTGPFGALLAPLFLWRASVRRTRDSSVLAAIVVITALVQLSFMLGFATAGPVSEARPVIPAALMAIGSRLGGCLLLGRWLPDPPGVVTSLSLAGITIAGLAWLVLRRAAKSRERRWIGAALLLLVAAGLYRSRAVLDLLLVDNAARYFVAPRVLIAWLVCTLLRDSGRRVRLLGAGTILVMLCTNAPRLKEGRLVDLHWQQYVPQIRSGQAVVIPINPQGWFVTLPAR
jgi:hypothetical protein